MSKKEKKLYAVYERENSTLIELVWANSIDQAKKDIAGDESVYEVEDLTKKK